MSINDVPQIREIFAWARLEEVQTTYTIAGKGAAKPAAELLIRGVQVSEWTEIRCCGCRRLLFQDDARRLHRRGADQVPALQRLQPSEAPRDRRDEPPPRAARPRWKGRLVWLFIPPLTPQDMTIFAASPLLRCRRTGPRPAPGRTRISRRVSCRAKQFSPRPLSWRGWRTRPWLRHLSGTICDPSTAALARPRSYRHCRLSLPAVQPCRPPQGEEDPRHLWPEVARIVAEVVPNGASSRTSPAICPLVSTSSPETFRAWVTGLQRASLAAAEVGASHLRERLFILAHADVQKLRKPRLLPAAPLPPEAPEGRGSDRQAAGLRTPPAPGR